MKKNRYFVWVISAVAATGGLLFGFDTGVISGAILFIGKSFNLSATTNGLVVSAVLLGAFIGALVGGRFADLIGRKKILLITAVIFIISTISTALAPNFIWLTLSRVVVGTAIGVSSFVVPLYISEIAPPQYRGMLVTFNQLLITVGIVASYMVDYAFASTANWRMMLFVGVVPAALLFFGMLFLPETPRWLVSKNYFQKAKNVLQKIRASENIESEFFGIEESLNITHGDIKMSLERWMWPALIIGFGLAFFQQTTGINTIIYYAPTIFKMAGFKEATTAILATLGVGIINVLFTIIALPLIDRIGRRPLLIFGLIGMTLSLLALSLAFHDTAQLVNLKWIALGSMMLYILCFAVSLGPIMWLMISEIFPLRIRGYASSITAAINWISNMVVAFTFLILLKAFGASGTFLLYGIISIIGLLFVFFMVPETKGISLEQIEMNLLAGKRSRDIGV